MSIDMWSIGVLLYELITNNFPFKGVSEGDQIFSILRYLGMPDKYASE